jgi:3-methyladenine DNA glycosylase AlkD
VKRASFALLASVALHDKKAPDAPFVKSLKLIERAANDERNFVKKGVSWALRGIGHRNPKLRAAAMKTAEKLARSDVASARWIGRDAIRDLSRPSRKKASAT